MRTALAVMASLLALAVLAGCAARPTVARNVTFVVVRHAEKQAGGDDPALTSAGEARARALASALLAEPVTAVYATGFRRAHDTAAPVAAAHGLEVRRYEASTGADALAAMLRREHPTGTVVVVGHSNTVPGIVSSLCGCAVAPIDEATYGGRYDVTIDPGGRAVLHPGRF